MQPSLSLCCLLLLCCALSNAALRKPKKAAAPVEANDTAKSQTEAPQKTATAPQTLARGWGDDIEWAQTYEEALAKSRTSKKPLMVIHHLEDCPYSQALKAAFVADPLAQKLAKEDFIMINLVHPVADENQSPDGHYVPRIMFVDPSMTVRTDLTGRYGNRLYAYESGDIPELVTNMKKANVLLHTEL
ncbi:anterior gradient protein 2 [Bombina bombina]|uniref:anterior gradient protein 2 n=1 Tax=Bombina bombina TaxID=8345 RepID=UPI00235AA017|nr:anterior gradient protein 2 [Bombina bombina]XP_053554856.1 anterior gradient protein 2 [Bombina bombina]XP_053554858.1 anterior gradient protein 2 [Bombina bombina]